MHKCEVLQPESFVLGCNLINLPLPNVMPPAKFCPRASHKSKDRPRLPPPAFACSADGYHPRVQHTELLSNIQACTCLTKIHNRSVAFVPQHVGSTGAEWSATVESNQCFLEYHEVLSARDGPKTRRRNFRQCTSNFRKCFVYILPFPAAKQTADAIMS